MASEYHDALVVGTGFAGLHQLYLVKQLGLDVKAVDSAGDVGGTWYWNRYPGARSDVLSYVYRYFFDKELLQTYPWPNNYLSQPELQAYFQEVARKHDLYRHIQFHTKLDQAVWDSGESLWRVKLSTGQAFRVRYLVSAIGGLHAKYIPDIPGLGTFKGQTTHSASWSDDIRWENKRIAVIGSGASGVQLVSTLAEKAQSLTHFIRHAQYVLPAGLRRVTSEERRLINERYDQIYRQAVTSIGAFGFPEPARPTFSTSPEDREAIFQDLWNEGNGFRFLFGGFSDLAVNADANLQAATFIHRKIKEIVKDENKAAALISSDYFARRPLTDDKYYDRFNQDNVFAVDLKKTPVESVTPDGVKTADGKLHPVDLIVFATGFDAFDGGYYRIDFRGRDGKTLQDHWAADGPKLHLSVTTSNFPNLFFLHSPGSPMANLPLAVEPAAQFVTNLVVHAEELRKNGSGRGVVESSSDADEKWQDIVNQLADATLFSKTPSWLFGNNIPGKKVAARFYFGGLGSFRKALADAKANGYEGFYFE